MEPSSSHTIRPIQAPPSEPPGKPSRGFARELLGKIAEVNKKTLTFLQQAKAGGEEHRVSKSFESPLVKRIVGLIRSTMPKGKG